MDLATLAAIAAIVALPTSILIWRMARIETLVDSLGGRIDATNSRIDITQGIIMRMLENREKQGK